MRFIFSVLLGVGIVFLIDYFFFKHNKFSLDGIKWNVVIKSILLYFGLLYASIAMQAIFSTLATVYLPILFIPAKIFGPIIIFVIFIVSLSKRHTLKKVSKILSYIYIIIIVGRIIYYMSNSFQITQEELYSLLPYIFLLLISVVIFYVTNDKNYPSGLLEALASKEDIESKPQEQQK